MKSLDIKYKGKTINHFPASRTLQAECTPVYEEMEGFKGRVRGVTKYSDLPVNAKKYLKRIEDLIGTKITLISLGRKREETISVNKENIWS